MENSGRNRASSRSSTSSVVGPEFLTNELSIDVRSLFEKEGAFEAAASIDNTFEVYGNIEAALVVSAITGPTQADRRDLEVHYSQGVRNVSVFLVGVGHLEEEEEEVELVQAEVRELLSSIGFSGDDVPIVEIESGSRSVREIVEMFERISKEAGEALGSRRQRANEALKGVLHADILAALSNPIGLILRGGNEGAAIEIGSGRWWAPQFQYSGGDSKPDPKFLELWLSLGGDEDPIGATLWWFYPNLWTDDRPPAELVGEGRDAELQFAVDRALEGNW